MRSEGVAAAAREMRRAGRAHGRINMAETNEQAEDAWIDFLTHAGKVYTKLRAACYGHPLDWGWFGKKLDERDREPLALYIHKARNSETHRLDDIITARRGGWPRHLRPLPVTDERGVIYQVPTHYKGLRLGDIDVATLAMFASDHLQDLVREATSRLR